MKLAIVQKLTGPMTRKFGKLALNCKRMSPELLLVGGIAAGAVGIVMACKASMKVPDILEEHNEAIEANPVVDEQENRDAKAIMPIYIHTAGRVLKTYGPAIALEGLSLGCILTSHGIMKKRNLALAVSLNGVSKAFKDYRKRVVDEIGAEMDQKFAYGTEKKVTSVVEKDKKGRDHTLEKEYDGVNGTGAMLHSTYAKIFDESNPNWEKAPGLNYNFLVARQAQANDMLRSKGYLFLNDVYKLLGFPETLIGQVAGWIYDDKNPVGDNYIDFGFIENSGFVNCFDPSTWLDFNVDGDILNSGRLALETA
jgi:hypothetical protein